MDSNYLNAAFDSFSRVQETQDVASKLDLCAVGAAQLCTWLGDAIDELSTDLRGNYAFFSERLEELRAIAIAPRTISRPWPNVVESEIIAPSDSTKPWQPEGPVDSKSSSR
jgi:hypothetical protein